MKKFCIALVVACSFGLVAVSNVAIAKTKASVTKTQTLTVTKTKININKATVAELKTLPCVGKKRAQAIVDYRTKNGNFKSVDDLKVIKGLSKKCLTKIADKATV